VIYLDTHVVAWLYAGEIALLPRPVRSMIEREQLLISPIVELELHLLHELGRVTQPGHVVVEALHQELDLARCEIPFRQVITAALRQSWTRDPFDRIIVAQAQVRSTRLLTKDQSIRDHYPEAVWLA
jgi:PIN domain nuclease of toxin-antitoxin system